MIVAAAELECPRCFQQASQRLKMLLVPVKVASVKFGAERHRIVAGGRSALTTSLVPVCCSWTPRWAPLRRDSKVLTSAQMGKQQISLGRQKALK